MGILEELNAKLESEVIKEVVMDVPATEAEQTEAELAMYEGYKEEGTTIEVAFANVDGSGNFFLTISKTLRIVMLAEDSSQWKGVEFDVEKRANTLGKYIPAVVKKIDTENGVVYVSAVQKGRDNENMIKINTYLDQVYKDAQEAGIDMSVEVNAVVRRVIGSHFVLMDIAKTGAIARVDVGKWANYYIRDLSAVCIPGQVYKIKIIGKGRMRGINSQTWIASHAEYTSDPWAKLDVKTITKGTVFIAKCIDTDYLVNQWWGVPIDGSVLPENIELRGTMKSGETAIRPVVGNFYECTVAQIIPERRTLWVAAYREALAGREVFGVRATQDK